MADEREERAKEIYEKDESTYSDSDDKWEAAKSKAESEHHAKMHASSNKNSKVDDTQWVLGGMKFAWKFTEWAKNKGIIGYRRGFKPVRIVIALVALLILIWLTKG